MNKRRKFGITASILICGLLLIGVALTYYFVVPRDGCNPEFIYLSYANPNNSSTLFNVIFLNVGCADGTIENLQSFSFRDENEILYPYRAYSNMSLINFPLIIVQGEKVNITLELNWHFIVDAEYTFMLLYDNGKSFEILFIFPGSETFEIK
ncbi:MAG: hypothetical protein JJE41_05430 [Candidatus Heimdallarchaeota archaeon]|nr:hypothetical protein [Candidatus Heimdallarchaeota archaeon]